MYLGGERSSTRDCKNVLYLFKKSSNLFVNSIKSANKKLNAVDGIVCYENDKLFLYISLSPTVSTWQSLFDTIAPPLQNTSAAALNTQAKPTHNT